MCLLLQYMKSLTATLPLYHGHYIGIIMGNKIIFTVLYIIIDTTTCPWHIWYRFNTKTISLREGFNKEEETKTFFERKFL